MSLENSKPDELLQAQLATYAAESLERGHRDHLIDGIGSVALHDQEPVTLMTEEIRIVPDGDTGFMKSAVVREEKTLAEPSGYARFLREKGGSRYEPIRVRAELLDNYKDFKPTVAAIQEELKGHELHTSHPNNLGRGTTSTGTLLEKGDQQYVMRSGMSSALKGSEADHYVDRMIPGRGLPHFEQLSAVSYEDGVVISERMAGDQLSKITPIELNRHVTDQQLDEMIDSLRLAQERDIELDPKADNTFYDKHEGFGFIDFNKLKDEQRQGHLSRHINYGSSLILAAGSPERPQTEQDYANALPFIAAEIALTQRYELACQRRLSEQELEECMPAVIERRNRLVAQYDEYNNPARVAERIANDRRRLEQQAARPKPSERNGFVSIELEGVM